MAVETLKDALVAVDAMIAASDKRKIILLVRQWGIDDAITQLHHGLGTKIRNDFLLWAPEGEKLRVDVWEKMTDALRRYYIDWWKFNDDKEYVGGAYMHPDDCSTEIMRAYLQQLTAEEQ